MQVSNSFSAVDPSASALKRSDNSLNPAAADAAQGTQLVNSDFSVESEGDAKLREAFKDFVGQTLFGQLMKSMRSTVGKPAYFHGGRTEEIFQSQLDAVMTEELTETTAGSYADPMYELFQLNRK